MVKSTLGSPKPDPVVVAEHMSSHILDDFEAVLDKLLKKEEQVLGGRGFSTTQCSYDSQCVKGHKCLDATSVIRELIVPELSNYVFHSSV
ncbi:hypothetical protein Anas_10953 [Armadillidium nasatum]|uniref:Uncharacterized protein n=1 Tax=Armadillidium nasatum TaxID=96803 RepID=A0A5N5T7M6_9CRUS|nr:hypothetical protein Anas_10953 [Armadillidium nasatum]